MEVTTEEMKRVCEIAASSVERRIDRFKPTDKPVIQDKKGWICERIFLGSVGDDLACSISIQWNYNLTGAVGRIYHSVHVQLRVLMKPEGRVLRVIGFHLPQWTKGDPPRCSACGDGFTERHVIAADTSLHEF